ncbi:unnamed protein product [Chrysodeixis includens]|uniref:ribonuclease III n=1 Tax=Chrysodeixis includens TaxID=689277 RepID=A0A9P0C3E5_CHRIL|nr:unnamed protein product [Chrysodeixis includens]
MMEASCSRFTAAEGGARLAAAAATKNILAVEYASFIPVRLLYEKAYQIRGPLSTGKKRSIYITRASRVQVVAFELSILTDLATVAAALHSEADWKTELESKEVVICTSAVIRAILEEGILTIPDINIMIIDSCHLIYTDENLQYIMKQYKSCSPEDQPLILALTYPLFTSSKRTTDNEEMGVYENLDDFRMYEKLEWKIEELEGELCCQMDLAEDIDGGKRMSPSSTKPRELVIEFGSRPSDEELPPQYLELEQFMKDCVREAMGFIDDHRHDPTEIYGEELYEEFMNIPDPTLDPKQVFKQFLYVLEQLGPYAADKAAFTLLMRLEKLKIKIPYERHFLLLCLCTTVFIKIRCYADYLFSQIEDEWEKIKTFSSKKVLRLAEILEKFQPPDAKDIKSGRKDSNVNSPDSREVSESSIANRTKKMLSDIEECDFNTLGNKIEDKVNTYVCNLKEIYDYPTESPSETDSPKKEINTENTSKLSETDTQNTNTPKSLNELDTPTSDSISDLDIKINKNTEDDENIETITTYDDTNKFNIPTSGTIIYRWDTNINRQDIYINRRDSSINRPDSGFSGHYPSISRPNSVLNGQDTSFNQPDSAIAGLDIRGHELIPSRGLLGFTRRTGHRLRGRTRLQRNNAARVLQMQQNPDALCGIVYMKEALIAKIMFMVIVDMSRCNPRLSHLCAQYCASETRADPGSEPRECQRQGKKQEEVLKKFRMHECNLLLATSALEEGIDLPRCNLVLRWDVPPSYRSYGLCRGRARAARATAALMCSDSPQSTEMLLQHVAIYKELDQIISRKCGCGIQDEPPQSEEDYADTFTNFIKPYTPNDAAIQKDKDKPDKKDKSKGNTVAERIEEAFKEKDRCIQKDNEDIENNQVDNLIGDTKDMMDIKDEEAVVIVENGHLEDDHDSIVSKTADMNINDKIQNSETGEIEIKIEQNEQKFEQLKKYEQNQETKMDSTIDGPVLPNEINRDENQSKDYCVKCCNVKINNICLCVNVTLYYTLLAKSNNNKIVKSDSKKSVSDEGVASVDLSTAIALINRYCGKLPSDTFTRLAPQWWMEEVQLPAAGSQEMKPAYICTLRLPLNCPVKYNIVGHPMPTKVLARRMVALQACRILHKSGELDNQLMPIGKENFKAVEVDGTNSVAYNSDSTDLNDAARPGTTKRRQYYYKRTAWAFTDCQPVVDTSDSEIEPPSQEGHPQATPVKEPVPPKIVPGKKRNMLYAIVSKLWCALPERYNTRGRRLHAPQHANQAIGILMARHEPDSLQIPAFPVYTRSGEVRVSVEHVPGADVRLSPRRGRLVRRFMKFVFAEVLRVRRRGMKLQSEGSTHNNYYIVPTNKTTLPDGTTKIDIDWAFLELIYDHTENKKLTDIEKPILWQAEEEKENGRRRRKKKMLNPLLEGEESFVFDAEKYREAVVTPWYRNQDQPQFFLVAEICWNLSPDSSFPSASHQSFRDYYNSKYGVTLTQRDQPLLDVDHTSARLNLLTPRYVNRKGVALPVSSERTRRAKRDRLDQKQILVPELCRVHPFAAPLWFATVALPCVLYRINALLIADEIRRAVAIDVGLGIPKINEKTMPGFQWPALDFGWSLAEVLSADSEKNEKKKEEEMKREQKEKELREKEEQEKKEKEEQEKLQQEQKTEEVKEKTINDILQEKLDAEGFEIGTWSNDMASAIPETEFDEMLEPLPPNFTFCTSASGGTSWTDPVVKPKFGSQFHPTREFSMADSDDSFMSSDLDSDDSDLDFDGSDEDTDTTGFSSSKNTNAAMGVRIEYKTAHEAEAVDVERCKKVKPAPAPDDACDARDKQAHDVLIRQGDACTQFIEKFHESVAKHKQEIIDNGDLITGEQNITNILPETKDNTEKTTKTTIDEKSALELLFPYGNTELTINNGQIDIESIERNKRVILAKIKDKNDYKKLNCFSMNDINIDADTYVNEKVVNVGFDTKEVYEPLCKRMEKFEPYYEEGRKGKEFDFDYQPKLEGHPGPSPSVILQALTMSNANDGINLERLETIGDSFLKFAITAYLYCAQPTVHEGKLSHMRSKQVSNLNLYRLGRNKRLGARMIASKFEPHDNWLPPCHKPPPTLHPRLNGDGVDIMQHLETPLDSAGCFIPYNLITQHSIPDKSIADCVEALIGAYLLECGPRGALLFMSWLGIRVLPCHHVKLPADHPYVKREENKKKQTDIQPKSPPQSPSPKRNRSTSSSSDCSSGDESPLQQQEVFPEEDWSWPGRAVGSLQPYKDERGRWMQPIFGELKAPPSPLLRYIQDPEGELEQMLSGYDALERTLQYRFKDRSLLLQALTHASHHSNRLTDCYQRLEFLGDAILDYLITRHLYEDPRRHSPGALTDLRSALVNNTIFATLAARHGFHKYFRHMSPGLNEVLTKYVKIQEENGHSISEEHYLIQEDEMEQAEDVEVPKALGDLFESVAGAIFLDSGMSLGAVWRSYVSLMGAELEAFSAAAPKSPVRELLEAEPDTATFGKPERLADGRRVRVCVEVFGRGTFKGVGRNYRIAKGTAARCALRHLRGNRR